MVPKMALYWDRQMVSAMAILKGRTLVDMMVEKMVHRLAV
jgi:hypothetical protein